MPLLRKPSEVGKPRSPVRPAGSAGLRGASKGGADARKAPSPLPPAAQPGAGSSGNAAPDDYAVPVREVVRPANQLVLTEAELEEEIGRALTAGNPSAPANLVRYSFRDRGYRSEPIIDQQLQHLLLPGCLMHRDSDEAARERQRRDSAALAARSRRLTAQSRRGTQAAGHDGKRPSEAGGGRGVRLSELGAGPSATVLHGEASGLLPPGEAEHEGRLRNQFNFADRAAQTGHQAPRERSTMTEPPPTATASGSCSRWEIFEAYVADQDRQRQTEELARQKAQVARRGAAQQQQQQPQLGGQQLPPAAAAQQQQQAGSRALVLARGSSQGGAGEGGLGLAGLPAPAAKLMERMVAQNLLKEVTMDFKYWDDPADAVRPEEGTLLPLWQFSAARAKRRAVTALAWSPRYADLFAVGYGSFDFLHPTTGLVAYFSLKNPGHPEYTFATPAGVMCLDFHPEHPSLLAVGCYDGRVCIFDVRAADGKPLYESTARGGKHADPVWQVCWQRTDSHELQLCSISTDGRVTLWTVSKNELSWQDLLELRSLRGRGERGGEGEGKEPAQGIAGGCCFDFNREQDYLFVVGAEDGSLYKCSTAYASEYLQAYHPGHRLPVYAVRWNGLHPRTFLSAGADWKVKLWDSLLPKPVLSFDLGAPVGDLAWAPFSSTVFAAVTDAGKVAVFDLAQNRGAAVCSQRVVRKARLTRLAFNARHPVLLVGDEAGGVHCLKLSPNLRSSFNQAAVDAADSKLARSETQKGAAKASEAVRLESVLELAGKCNAALQEEDWELM
ncbi:hypothetical protein ABPG75_000542 [Micractinium tetrahymenae]